ncbi:MAG: diguanylate cyclase [Candidatus Gastranaerophilales bacterium]
MKLFKKFAELNKKIREIENDIYGGKEEYLEIYERNVELEKEIEIRTNELNLANKRMLTLQHILDIMNASKPLQGVLESTVNSLQGELGYLHSNIIKKETEDDKEYISILAYSKGENVDRINSIIKGPLDVKKLNYDPDGFFAQALYEKKITHTLDIKKAIQFGMPDADEKIVEKVLKNIQSKSFISIPLYIRNKPFGWLCVFSPREEITDAEKDFLNMYAQQIEIAITIADLFETVKEQAVTDGLTGLYNRRYFEEFMQKEVRRSLRQQQPFSIIGLDLDHLKQINDNHGHSFGDLAIKTVAEVLQINARSVDIAARMGGEEFNLILPGIDSEGAMIAAERIRKAIEDVELDTIQHITASIGVATFLEHSDKSEDIIELTDQAMYQSKREGRNRVTLAKTITETSWQEIALNTFIEILSKRNIPLINEISQDLSDKLKQIEPHSEAPKEMLYSVADMLTQTYNPLHTQGTIKSKVQLASSLAKRFDLAKEEIDNLKIAILLYDIGNLMISTDILQKSTPLTIEEQEQIKKHPIIAAKEILQPISYIQDIIPIVEHHHENWDGSGYPGKISKEEIPMTSQIVLIVDAYFALTEKRTYRSKLSPKEALEIIKQETNKKYNEALVLEFINLVEHDTN